MSRVSLTACCAGVGRRLPSLLIGIALALCGTWGAAAQEPLRYGAALHGQVNDTQPRSVYAFDGLRGDVISLTMTVTSGDFEALLLLFDGAGRLIDLPDEAPGRDVRISSFILPTSAVYSVVVTRFGDRLGTTSGEFALMLERVGVSSQQGSVLRYGDSVYNTIDDDAPRIFYSFQAARGDIISVQIQRASGDLDPTLQIVNSRSEVIAENDDRPGSTDAAISGYTVREDGVYVIVASRYGEEAGESQGAFVLTLSAGEESGLGGSAEFAITLEPGTPVRGSITDTRVTQVYRFEGQVGQRVTVRMDRRGGNIDPLVVLADVSGRELVQDDDTGGGQNAAIIDFPLPADGVYLVLATRFERDAGSTAGEYTLSLTVAN
ncbi:MAG: PPC domain-containing protein [Anaerolineae bacterium]|nr:PPC domain-containing protein [Anaerolineae bacterium]NUQ03020.1 PPC domain-containing protein [Anaerolineae bacterium]